jgi:hypothetical protein
MHSRNKNLKGHRKINSTLFYFHVKSTQVKLTVAQNEKVFTRGWHGGRKIRRMLLKSYKTFVRIAARDLLHSTMIIRRITMCFILGKY